MLGEFLGLTGISATLLDTNIARYTSMLNNPLDSFRISHLRLELQYLLNFLDTKVKMEYTSPELRRLLRRSDLVRNNSIIPLKKAYGIDIEGMNEQERESYAISLEREVEEMAKKDNSPKSIINSFIVPDTGERVSLGGLELKVLDKFKTYYYPVIKRYERSCSTDTFREISVFGEKLHNIAVRSPLYLLSLVTTPSVNREEWVSRCLEWAEVIKSHFDTEEEMVLRGSETTEDIVRSSLNFSNYMLTVKGLDPVTNSVNDLPEDVKKMVDRFHEESEEFVQILSGLSRSKGWKSSYLKTLTDLYYRVFRLDNDPEFISEALFPESSGIVVGLDEISNIYRRLNNIGFYFFHLTNTELFLDSLRKVTFSSDKTVIDPDKEIHGYTFRRIVDDIENYCYSMVPMGTPLEEVK